MDRILPRKRDRAVAIDLPVIKTPEDAEAALAVVTAELAAGQLTIREATGLVALIERMLRVAERVWAFGRSRRHGAAWDAVTLDDVETPAAHRKGAEADEPEAAETAEEPDAPLYSPVNSAIAVEPAPSGPSPGEEGEPASSEVPRHGAPPLPRAA